jgi:hypothetical protein
MTSTTTTETSYTNSIGVGLEDEKEPVPVTSPDDSQWALDWLASDAARQYDGKWVAIGRDLVVRASGPSPSALRESRADESDLAILFVIPRNIVLVGSSRLTCDR